jgi:hypothetical protein
LDIDNVEGQILILQSKSTYARLLELNQINGFYRETRRVVIEGVYPKLKINGVFEFLNGVLVALYATAGCLTLRVGNKVMVLDKDVEVIANGDSNSRLLTVNQGGNKVVSLIYSISDASVSSDDLTPFVENEDFDFGLFVANVTSNAGRRCVVLENW